MAANPMQLAVEAAEAVRGSTAPNPWVGAVLTTADARRFVGATEPPPGRHAERVALDAAVRAGATTSGAVLHTTLEPCCRTGRTPPCTEAIINAGVAHVVVGITDPDPAVDGAGIAALRAAGVEVTVGEDATGEGSTGEDAIAVAQQLEPYLHHRRTGRPWVVLKLAATADGRTAAPDGTSQWITGTAARTDAHRLRARCDTVLVGAGTVRSDNPSLTVRHCEGTDPRRVVLGTAPADAAVQPCWEMSGEPGDVLEKLGAKGVVELLVEGGPTVAAAFHRAGLVDEYVLYIAPALMGGDDGRALFAGDGAPTINQVWRGKMVNVTPLGDDLSVTLRPRGDSAAARTAPKDA